MDQVAHAVVVVGDHEGAPVPLLCMSKTVARCQLPMAPWH